MDEFGLILWARERLRVGYINLFWLTLEVKDSTWWVGLERNKLSGMKIGEGANYEG